MIIEDLVGEGPQALYSAALRRVLPDTLGAYEATHEREELESARATLALMPGSARLAEAQDAFLCSDSGVPTYPVEIAGSATWKGDLERP